MSSLSHRRVRACGMRTVSPCHWMWAWTLMYACSTAVTAKPGMATLSALRKTSTMLTEKQAGPTANGPDMIRGLVAAVYSPIAVNQSLHLDPVSIDAQVRQHCNLSSIAQRARAFKYTNKLRCCSISFASYLQHIPSLHKPSGCDILSDLLGQTQIVGVSDTGVTLDTPVRPVWK